MSVSVSLRNSTNCDYRSTIQADHKKTKTPKTHLFLFFLLQQRKLKSKGVEASSLLLFLSSTTTTTTTTTTLLPCFETIQQQQKNLSLLCLSVCLSVQPSLSPLCWTQQNSATYFVAQIHHIFA